MVTFFVLELPDCKSEKLMYVLINTYTGSSKSQETKSDSKKYKELNSEGYIAPSGHTDSLLHVHNTVKTVLSSLQLISVHE